MKRPKSNDKPFWQNKNLFEMTAKEWESLCDGCGLCCLSKVEDEDTGEVFVTNVHCKLYDPKSCSCRNYVKRKRHVPDCVVLTPKKVLQLDWLPRTCAYRLIAEGKPLYSWHPLVSGSKDSVHRHGVSTKSMRLVSEDRIKDLRDHIWNEVDVRL